MDQQRLFKQLDEAEDKLLARWDTWLNSAFRSIPWRELERLAKSGQGPRVLSRIPPLISADPSSIATMLSDHGAEMVTAGLAHGEILVEELHHRYRNRKLTEWIYDDLSVLDVSDLRGLTQEAEDETSEIVYGVRKLADLPGFDFQYGDDPRIIPEKAIKAMTARSIVLAGDVEGDLTAALKKVMVRFLAGESRKATEQAVEELLHSNRERATLITTTETTYSYNRGRLAGFAENRVDYVRFSAVMDGRTSPVCRSRHGLIMRMNDPEINSNTPPLHGRCRSVLDPLYSAYQGDLITSASLDWSGVAQLPKGWKTAA